MTRAHIEAPRGTFSGFGKCCEAVRGAVPVEEVARRHTELRPYAGARAWFTGRCPLPDHEDRTPSFYIYPGEEVGGRWWCYGCNRGGDVVDLEFHCGDHRELWTAMIALAVEHNVQLPERPRSWHRRQERQRPVRDGIEEAKVRVARRRLYRTFFEGLVLATEDPEDREHDAELFWELTEPLARHLVANLMGAGEVGG